MNARTGRYRTRASSDEGTTPRGDAYADLGALIERVRVDEQRKAEERRRDDEG